jgi:hypothetical protein
VTKAAVTEPAVTKPAVAEPNVVPLRRRRWSPARPLWPLAASIAFAVLVGGGWWTWAWWQDRPGYRRAGTPAVESLLVGAAPLPRDRAVLRWRGPEGARYDVWVLTEGMEVVFEASGLKASQAQIPAPDLAGVPAGATLLWGVEAVLPDGRRVASPTFEAKVREAGDRNP